MLLFNPIIMCYFVFALNPTTGGYNLGTTLSPPSNNLVHAQLMN